MLILLPQGGFEPSAIIIVLTIVFLILGLLLVVALRIDKQRKEEMKEQENIQGNIIPTELFMFKEAMASVALSKDPEMQTMCEGLLTNSKLYDIGVKIENKHTGELIWQGPVAQVCNQIRR